MDVFGNEFKIGFVNIGHGLGSGHEAKGALQNSFWDGDFAVFCSGSFVSGNGGGAQQFEN